jgi:branched-chain amino acid transport system permease protein
MNLNSRFSKWLLILFLFGVLVSLPNYANGYIMSSAVSILIYITLTTAWNLFSGTTGYLSFGHLSFFGCSAYLTAIFINTGWNIIPAVLVSALCVTLVFAPIAWILLRLKGSYFVVGTLGLSSIILVIANSWSSVTGGVGGITVSPADTLISSYYILIMLAILYTFVTWYIYKTRFGLRLFAIKSDEIGTEAIGFNPAKEKIIAFLISIFMTAIIGGIYTYYFRFIEPGSVFGTRMVIDILLMGVLGGMGTILGPIVGALIVGFVSQLVWSYSPEFHSMLFGLAIILIATFIPQGVLKNAGIRHYSRKGNKKNLPLMNGTKKEVEVK